MCIENLTESKNYEPKRNSRFAVYFPEVFNISPYSIEKIDKPKFYNGKWQDIRVDFVDIIPTSTSKGLLNLINFLLNDYKDDNSNLLFIL